MDSRGRAYYIKAAAAAAAAAAGDATDDEEPAELAPKAVSQKKQQVDGQGTGLSCDADGAAAVRDDLTCPECGKVFLSDKSMYGHLRAHPQRKYKGATRPAAMAADDAFVAEVKTRPWKVPRKEAELEDRHPGRSPVTGKRGRPASSASSGSAPAPYRLQLVLTEEEAAMTLLDMASGRRRPLEQPTQPAHVTDALPGPTLHQMPSVEQDAHAVAVHHDAPGVQQLSVPDHVAGNDAEQRTWEAEKPALAEHVFGIVKEPLAQEAERVVQQEEHVAAVTADLQTPEAKAPVKLGPVTEAVPVLGDKNGHADIPVSPGTTKKPVKRRIQDVEQPPPSPPPPAEAADVKPPPVRRIPSPASKKKYECAECHKTFPSHQALGGHVAAHKRQKKSCVEQQQHEVPAAVQVARHNFLVHQRPGVVVDAPVVAAGGGLGPLGEEGWVSPPSPAPRPQHQCARCPMIFPTGQALGGHMRKHFLERKEQELASATATPAPPTASFTPAPPPMMTSAAPVQPIAGATPAPPIASAAPPPPMANGATPETPIGSAAPAPPTGNAAPEQPGINLFDLNELPKEDAGENHQP